MNSEQKLARLQALLDRVQTRGKEGRPPSRHGKAAVVSQVAAATPAKATEPIASARTTWDDETVRTAAANLPVGKAEGDLDDIEITIEPTPRAAEVEVKPTKEEDNPPDSSKRPLVVEDKDDGVGAPLLTPPPESGPQVVSRPPVEAPRAPAVPKTTGEEWEIPPELMPRTKPAERPVAEKRPPEKIEEKEPEPAPEKIEEKKPEPAPEKIEEKKPEPAPEKIEEKKPEPAPEKIEEKKPEPAADKVETTVQLIAQAPPQPIPVPTAREFGPITLEVEGKVVSAGQLESKEVAVFTGAVADFRPMSFLDLLDASLSLGK